MKPCPYCDWNDDHPYHYPDCPQLEIARLRASLARVQDVEELMGVLKCTLPMDMDKVALEKIAHAIRDHALRRENHE